MSKYKLGNKVRVRDDLIVENRYGSETFVDNMNEFKGKVVTIGYISSNHYHIEEDEDEWCFTDEMFVDKNKDDGISPIASKEPIVPKNDLLESFLSLQKEYADLYALKNKKYGDSFGISVRKYGLISALTRMSDKWNRIENLILNEDDGTDDESLIDSLGDLSNYCLMTIMEIQDKGGQ